MRDGAGTVSVGERVLSQLLQEMDGLHDRQEVVVVAATNRPDCLDPALLRPGRFDRLLHVPPPDEAARCAIFAVHTKKMPLDSSVDLADLAHRTEGYTGADITAICRQAALAALDDSFEAKFVEGRHFAAALQVTLPSGAVSDAAAGMYERFSRHGMAA